MNFLRFQKTIQSDEGFRSVPYLDTVGVPTIGYGTTEYIQGYPVTMDDPEITQDHATTLMNADLWTAVQDAQDLVDVFNDLNDVRQEVVANMAYNLGWSRLSGFKKMLAALEMYDYEEAADQMIDSKWYRQVGDRSVRLEQEMRTGVIT